MQAVAERRHRLHTWPIGKLGREPHEIATGCRIGDEPGLREDLIHRPVREQNPVGDVGNLVTALGFVHVMGRYQHRQPFAGEDVDLVPELAPRFRVDTGGRLVKQ